MISYPSDIQFIILVVDDEKSVREVLRVRLTMMGYTVITASDGESAVQLFQEHNPDVVVLDVMMPKVDGFQVCQQLRENSTTPIIFLTALEDVPNRLKGLALGADDYLVKPFSLKELETRIRTILRRVRGQEYKNNPLEPGTKRLGHLIIDFNKRRVYKEGSRIDLTELEFKLIDLLSTSAGTAISRNDLLERIWGYDPNHCDTRVVDVHISRLRSKIEIDPRNPEYILTIRGEGYMVPEIIPEVRRIGSRYSGTRQVGNQCF